MNKFQTRKGVILLDILIAFSLAILFVSILMESLVQSQQIYEQANSKKVLLDMYDAGNVNIVSRLYGNEGKEDDIEIASSSQRLSFVEILENIGASSTPENILFDYVGIPLCSIDYGASLAVGSFKYFNQSGSTSLSISITPITLPVNPLLPLTDMQVRDGTAYITADSAIASDPDLIIADISNPQAPKIISTLNTGPGLSALAIAGRRIFAAAPSATGQLQVIRLDGLTSPILEKKFKLQLPYATATPALGSAVSFSNNMVYLGTEKWDGDEFNVINVSNSIAPMKVGGFEVGSKVNNILTDDMNAYVTSAGNGQLLALNVSDAAHIELVNSFSPSGWQRQEGKALSIFEKNLNLGRTSGGFNFTTDHEIFAWQSSTSAMSATSFADPISLDITGGVYGIVRDRNYVFLATRTLNQEFQIIDTSLDPSSVVSFSLPVAPQMMTCDGDSLYILAHTAPMIYKINFRKNV